MASATRAPTTPEFPNAEGGDGTDIGAFEVQTIVPLSTRFRNLSTRLVVGHGPYSGIGGFIISGDRDKSVLVRAIGPSLGAYGVTGTLADPVL